MANSHSGAGDPENGCIEAQPMTSIEGRNKPEVRGSTGPVGSIPARASARSAHAFTSIHPPLAKALTSSARTD
ncbi:MAG: hypothetical protein ACK5OA_10170 [Acidovorax sp.]